MNEEEGVFEDGVSPTLQKSFAGNYKIIELLGKGGMSLVFRAKDNTLDRDLAIKVLNRAKFYSERDFERFRNEAKVCSLLKHGNIVQILSFGITSNDLPYIVMEFLEGKTLEQILEFQSKL